MSGRHLAQLNVGRLLAPTDPPIVSEFMPSLDTIDALAEAAPGFIRRLRSAAGNATDIKLTDDELFVINLSVGASVSVRHHFKDASDPMA
jgi:hypothetical protein